MDVLYALYSALLLGVDPAQLGMGSFAVLAVVAVGVALVWLTARGPAAWPFAETELRARRGAMRGRQRRARPILSRDPDAPGKSRPRAPGAALAA